MNIIFVGTSAFGIPALDAILTRSQHRISLVVTRPDKPKGRGLKEEPSHVKIFAGEHNLKTFQPEDINSKNSMAVLKAHLPDVIVVVAFGRKLGEKLLALPHFSCINIHASLLPQYRGAAPIFHALRNGEAKTGVTIFRVIEKMDAGPILGARETDIAPSHTAGELSERLAKLGAELLLDVLDNIEKDKAEEMPQDESKVTYAPKIIKGDLVINWQDSAQQIVNLVRALSPQLMAKTTISIGGKRIDAKIGRATIFSQEHRDNGIGLDTKIPSALCPLPSAQIGRATIFPQAPGECGKIISVGKDGLIVSAKDGCVSIERIQPENKRLMSVADFINGYHPQAGDFFLAYEYPKG